MIRMMVYGGIGRLKMRSRRRQCCDVSVVYWSSGRGNAEDAVFNEIAHTQIYVCGDLEKHKYLFCHTDIFFAPKLGQKKICVKINHLCRQEREIIQIRKLFV